jgi:YD repeat-containing protein
MTTTDRDGISQTFIHSCKTLNASCPAVTPNEIARIDGLLIKVTDNFGYSLNFTYNSQSQLITMENPAGNLTLYAYDGDGNLKTVTYPDDTAATTDNPKATYHYGDDPGEAAHVNFDIATNATRTTPPDLGVTYTHALTGITDEDGIRFATYKYDGAGRAVRTVHNGGVARYSLAFSPDDPSTTGVVDPVTTITDPLGSQRSTHFATVLGILKPTATDQPAGSGCGPAASNTTYDPNGNVASRTDFNGHKVCYQHDLARNLETARVEGLASVADCPAALAAAALPANARKASTAWHPDWRLAAKVAEPKRLTTTVYNGQLDPATGAVASCAPAAALVGGKPIAVLCKRAEQATTDPTGAAGLGPTVGGPVRAWAYTYNADGQVLTANGPRGDVLDRTTYAYYPTTAPGHTEGDLWTTANALGHTTTFNSYDGNGRPTQVTAPNGVTTTLAYYPRGWLKSLTVAAADGGNVEATHYTYEPTGLLKTATQPDGSVLTYGYDNAHRLTQVTDSLGNKVSYTLDNLGNRLKDNYWDPTSAPLPDDSVSATGLRAKVTRTYDALARLQTLTTGGGQ